MATHECTEEEQHRAARRAAAGLTTWLLGYQDEHGLSDMGMLVALGTAQWTFLRYVERDDEERRTGYRHRMAGE